MTLARTADEYGDPLRAGQVVLSKIPGLEVPYEDVDEEAIKKKLKAEKKAKRKSGASAEVPEEQIKKKSKKSKA